MRSRTPLLRKPDLVTGGADDVFEVRIADGEKSAGKFEWALVVVQGTERQVIKGEGWWGLVREGATVTGDLDVSEQTKVITATGGTLTLAWTYDLSSGTKMVVAVNATTSLAPSRAFVDLHFFQRTADGDIVIV